MAKLSQLLLRKQISFKIFVFTQIAVLALSLLFLGFLYYILNQNQPPQKSLELYFPVSSKIVSLTLEIEQPADNTLTFQKDLLLTGKTAPFSKVLITTNTNDLIIDSKKDGSFSTVLELEEGVNYIETTVVNLKGDGKKDDRTVFYSEEKI